MKKIFTIMMTVAVFFSCNNTFLPPPVVPPADTGNTGIPPEFVSATHGERRSITLSWNQVQNAELYYIYRANSPLDTFVRSAETSANEFRFNVSPGSSVYYRVSSVSIDGRESTQSAFVMGTSLAQPVISDITGITEDSAAVTWYMENVSDDTYKNNLLYTVYCFNGPVEIAQIALDGSAISENRAVFTGLNANTAYEYQVEAYLRSDQNASEKSDRVDAATARRFRPGPPVNLRSARGTAVDSVALTFELPDMVDIALGDNMFDPKPLYFVISKRLYSESGNNEYQMVREYFGTNAAKGGGITNYNAGTAVTWSDTNVIRGVTYEYLVQSYVDDINRIISSDTSRANSVGWALSEGTLSFGTISYTPHESADLFISAKLPIDFNFDTKGETYEYTLIENIEPIDDDDANDPDSNIERRIPFLTYDALLAHIPAMDLTIKTNDLTPGRGVYSYAVEINLNNQILDTVTTIGKVEVSENTQPIVVENFRVQDGYRDQFILKWTHYSNRRYAIYRSGDRITWEEIAVVNPNPSNDDDPEINSNFSHTVSGYSPNAAVYFAVRPSRDIGGGSFRQGQMVYASAVSQTLGIPELLPGSDASYSSITILWREVQKADTYRIKYRYTGGSEYTTAETVKKEDISLDANGQFRHSFRPEGYNDAGRSGREIQVMIDALNESLRLEVGGGEIFTSSANVASRLVGPALLDTQASGAASATEIDVSWNTIPGAAGYYVFRRQFGMNNASEEGSEAVVYYVPASISSSNSITGKNLALESNSRVDTATVKAAASLEGSRYTLRDMYLPDNEYSTQYANHIPAYRNQQNDLAQGMPYRYYVVPVITRGSGPEPLTSIDFIYARDANNKNTSISSYTIQESGAAIQYSGAAALEQTGFTIGFGQNVTASKGTYASSGNENNGIRITWSPPPLLAGVAGFSPRYTLYRKTTGSVWNTVSTNLNALEYIDNPDRGIAHEYTVGIANGSGSSFQPHLSERFIALCGTLRDEKNRPNLLGYMLDMVRMESVSRNEIRVGSEFAEEVKWYSAGIANSYSADHNWGIDGYTVFVMNRNINASWHEIADITTMSDQTNQSTSVTPGSGSITFNDGIGNNSNPSGTQAAGNITRSLLFVLRDYKHFFKVRSYVLNDEGTKIYCPDPPYTYQYHWGANVGGLNCPFETEYVKWGARQITAVEYMEIASLWLAEGLQRINGTAWNTGFFGRSSNAPTGVGGSGSISASSNFGVSDWTITYNNYKSDLQTRTGNWVTFLTINGRIRPFTSATNQYPQRYGHFNFVDITGPADTPGLYTGQIQLGTPDVNWTSGTIHVIYPAGTAQQSINFTGQQTALPFSGQGNERHQGNRWR
ncbi:MAG: hypothetical protein FWG89_01055 [Treponema sp.]|nr:hypothetical protein [Treponema sp.]